MNLAHVAVEKSIRNVALRRFHFLGEERLSELLSSAQPMPMWLLARIFNFIYNGTTRCLVVLYVHTCKCTSIGINEFECCSLPWIP